MKNTTRDTGQCRRPTPRQLLAGAICLLLVCGCFALGAVRRQLTDRTDQQAAQRWSGDGTAFAQLSVYLSEEDALTARQLQSIRSTLAAALNEASLEPVSEDARLWLDAVSLLTAGSASTDRGSTTVNITAAGGDYFHFHPLQLKSGSTFSDADLQHDTIVLDELAAWQLFGSADVTGKPVKLNGQHYYVCGVAAVPTDAASMLTYGEHPRVWVFYDSLPDAENLQLTCYEAVLPEPYTGFARQLAEDAFDTENTDCILQVNSSRYGFASLWKTLTGLTRAAMRPVGIAYPWWENAAVHVQSQAALLLLAQLALGAGPALLALVLAWKLLRTLLRRMPTPKQLIETAVDRRRTAAWNAAMLPAGPAQDKTADPHSTYPHGEHAAAEGTNEHQSETAGTAAQSDGVLPLLTPKEETQ